ncbi:endonuclease [[Clostridium] sordellii]|uniref:YraN family protein n=1 Tax=Paraclostridium sordellii TaxID=1505 RepID=UPI0005DD77FE|nr:YraN family protein [Paeniclostridium sordellii]MBX9181040.1 YraN family protein [Paeniclostridium sordellii]MDU1455996.1 YraN family protein [Paeniclostridium sordellii]MDU6114021.1 YraN family protein [Paeniclostridium sordellii]CEO10092.1 endonuclease [[Clostridium] sordellii] [Paeniclostridium sordellii]CEO13571.1 endonuclease [[Clostridium] sordellii] [Paeniclostridium sordellii]
MNNIEKGRLGEKIATEYLKNKGIYIIKNNYKIKFGEIDIIAKIEDLILFIEVKSRNSNKFGYPAEAVNYKKRSKITNVAKYYMAVNNLENVQVRFDVIEIYLKDRKVNHIESAF